MSPDPSLILVSFTTGKANLDQDHRVSDKGD